MRQDLQLLILRITDDTDWAKIQGLSRAAKVELVTDPKEIAHIAAHAR